MAAMSVRIERAEEKLLRLTEEQYDRLEELEDNPRCLFEGAAGTGKTLLAVEFARRRARAGDREPMDGKVPRAVLGVVCSS